MLSIVSLLFLLPFLSFSVSVLGRSVITQSLLQKIRLTVKRIKRQNPHFTLCGSFNITNIFKGKTDGGGQGRSIGISRASLHAYGGALYSVMCSQRKYHNTRLRVLADSPANGCLQRWCFSLCPWSLHLPNLGHSRRTRCPAQRRRNISACPMQL